MKILSSNSMKYCDKQTMIDNNVNEIDLVKRAALACFNLIRDDILYDYKVLVVCGNSNNSADGFRLAKILKDDKVSVDVSFVGNLKKMNETCSYFYKEFEKRHLDSLYGRNADYKKYDVIIDAIIGVGLKGELREDIVEVVNKINDTDAIKIAIDIPTGLNSDTGTYKPVCVKADYTAAINNIKYGHLLADGPDVCGEIAIADIGLNSYNVECIKLIDEVYLGKHPKRAANCNKYDFGSVLVIGSNISMTGAGIMASLSALRSGAGLLSLACPKDNYEIVSKRAPLEVMVRHLDEDLDLLLNKKTTVVFGPGLGRDEKYLSILERMLKKDINLIVDADGLHLLSKIDNLKNIKKCRLVITPHTGEAAVLLNKKSVEVKEDVYTSLRELVKKYDCIAVLKGHNTLIGDVNETYISVTGNSGMATAGSGDVLAGMIAGFALKEIDLKKVCKAVYLHGLAGDIAESKRNEDSLIATDIIENIGEAIRTLY